MLALATASQASPNAQICGNFHSDPLPASTLVRQRTALPL